MRITWTIKRDKPKNHPCVVVRGDIKNFLYSLSAAPVKPLELAAGRLTDARKTQTSPRPPIATVSQMALIASSHTAPSNPRLPCTPLNRLRTSSTALALILATSVPAPAAEPPATTAAAADKDNSDLGRWRRRNRRNTASEGRTTQRRKRGA